MNKEDNIENKDKVTKITYHEIVPECVYLTIPISYMCVYHKLLAYMADFGKTIIDDCNTICKGHGKNIIGCWNMFQAAIACHNLNREKEAEVLINYIKKQLDISYKGTTKGVYTGTMPVTITEDGKLKAVMSCKEGEPHFFVDTRTMMLYETYPNGKVDNKEYKINDNDLIVEENEKSI